MALRGTTGNRNQTEQGRDPLSKVKEKVWVVGGARGSWSQKTRARARSRWTREHAGKRSLSVAAARGWGVGAGTGNLLAPDWWLSDQEVAAETELPALSLELGKTP